MLFLITRIVSIVPQSVEKSQADEARASVENGCWKRANHCAAARQKLQNLCQKVLYYIFIRKFIKLNLH